MSLWREKGCEFVIVLVRQQQQTLYIGVQACNFYLGDVNPLVMPLVLPWIDIIAGFYLGGGVISHVMPIILRTK